MGEGPCGANCSEKDVDTMTNDRRLNREDLFGTFKTSYIIEGVPHERDINSIVRSNYSEWVVAVSEKAQWEQELMKFSFELKNDTDDIK